MPRETLRPASLRLWSGPRGIPIHHIRTHTHTTHTHIGGARGGGGVRQTRYGRSQALTRSCAGTLARVRSLSLTLAPPFRTFKVPSIVTPVVTSFSLRLPDQIPSLRGIPGSRFGPRDPPPFFGNLCPHRQRHGILQARNTESLRSLVRN